mmetsp:Transcript_5820/g.11667  ORF Transcript_5820/g.11667 Transcript_5820/m.11667 type:complete len:284 (-) Transcript_5820:1091-1942(-)
MSKLVLLQIGVHHFSHVIDELLCCSIMGNMNLASSVVIAESLGAISVPIKVGELKLKVSRLLICICIYYSNMDDLGNLSSLERYFTLGFNVICSCLGRTVNCTVLAPDLSSRSVESTDQNVESPSLLKGNNGGVLILDSNLSRLVVVNDGDGGFSERPDDTEGRLRELDNEGLIILDLVIVLDLYGDLLLILPISKVEGTGNSLEILSRSCGNTLSVVLNVESSLARNAAHSNSDHAAGLQDRVLSRGEVDLRLLLKLGHGWKLLHVVGSLADVLGDDALPSS